MTRIIVTGYIVKCPLGGMTWHYLQYLLGLRRLGYDVYFLENSTYPLSCYDPELDAMTDDCSYGTRYLTAIMKTFNMADKWVYIDYTGNHYGRRKSETTRLLKQADALVNIGGTCWLPEFTKCPKTIYIDVDPAHTQFKVMDESRKLGGGFLSLKYLHQYDVHFTYGMNIGEPDCSVPTCGIEWKKTRQPIVLDLWTSDIDPALDTFTTIMSWADGLGAIIYEGKTYGMKDVEFQKFLDLPKLSKKKFELALGGSAPRQFLQSLGWKLVDPRIPTKDLWSYQRYIQSSRAEWSVARNAYVKTWCGWFSDRSACYMASGKPVLVQDTGFSKYLPVGKGLIAFDDMESVLKGVDAIDNNYDKHCLAARRVAEVYFNSNNLLKDLLQKAEV